MSNFKAIVLNKTGEQFTREVKSIDKNFLMHGDVLVKRDTQSVASLSWMLRRGQVKLTPSLLGLVRAKQLFSSIRSLRS